MMEEKALITEGEKRSTLLAHEREKGPVSVVIA